MNSTSTRTRHRSCEKHFGRINGFTQVCAEDLVRRLSIAKEVKRDPNLIVLDTREGRLYQLGHLVNSLSMSCYTKTMARRALVVWDSLYAGKQCCLSPRNSVVHQFSVEPTEKSSPDIVLYDHRGECPFCGDSTALGYFIDALIVRGNHVFLLKGGFDAFRNVSSPDFIETGSAKEIPTVSQSSTLQGLHVRRSPFANLYTSSCNQFQKSKSSSPQSSPRFNPLLPNTSFLMGFAGLNSGFHAIESFPKSVIPLVTDIEFRTSIVSPKSNPEDALSAPIAEILPYLYIGNSSDAQNQELLTRLGVTHIINAGVTAPSYRIDTQRFQYLSLPLTDTEDQNLRPSIDHAVEFIYEAEKSGGIILVHCLAGVSRSVAVVMAYLMHKYRNFNVLRAFEFVQSRRPVAGPNLHFLAQLERFYNELHSQPCQDLTTSPHHHSQTSSYGDISDEFSQSNLPIS